MKVFFVASPRSVNREPENFRNLFGHIEKDNKMLSDWVLDWGRGNVESFYSGTHKERIEHFKETMDYIKRAELVIVEVSEHSMSMGYIVNKALEIGKPVIALFKEGFEPYFFSGIEDTKLQIVGYDENNYRQVLDESVERARSNIDVRFNFFVSPKILNYLDWVAKKRMIPRSVFLRNLIEREMKKDKEFAN